MIYSAIPYIFPASSLSTITRLRLALLRVVYILLLVFTLGFELRPSSLIGECFVLGEGETVSISFASARRRRLHTDSLSLWIAESLE